MEHLTIVSAYYEQPQIMEEWWRVLMTYAEPERVKLRFCDDGSPKNPLVIPDDIKATFDVKAFRAVNNVPWNEMGCRNLCMRHSNGWVYMTDPDYILNAENVRRLLAKDCQSGNFYHLQSRLVGTGRELHMPENMVVLHTTDFWKTGGYDEELAGGYGFSDCLMFKCLREHVQAKDNFVMDVFMTHYPKGNPKSAFAGHGEILDAATPAVRDTRRNQPIFDAKLALIRQRSIRSYVNLLKPIQFQWEQTV